MSRLLREKFVELHERPLLEELRAELQQQFPGVSNPATSPAVVR